MSETRDLLERIGARYELRQPAFERLMQRRDRRQRNRRVTAGVVGLAVFGIVVWIFSSGGSLPRTAQVPGTNPTTVVPRSDPVGLIGFPASGAEPSTPKRGELVASVTFGHTSGDPGRFTFSVYADGRVLWEQLGNASTGAESTGVVEQRLSPAGIQLVMDEVRTVGLLDRDRKLIGATVLYFGSIELYDGGRTTTLGWGDLTFGHGFHPVETTPTHEQISALKRLDSRLEDLSWLPDTAWDDPVTKAFVPTWYRVCYSGREEPIERSRILDALPAAVGDRLRELPTTGGHFNGARGRVPVWCSVLPLEQARELSVALDDRGATMRDPEFLSQDFTPAGSSAVIAIDFNPVFPDRAPD